MEVRDTAVRYLHRNLNENQSVLLVVDQTAGRILGTMGRTLERRYK